METEHNFDCIIFHIFSPVMKTSYNLKQFFFEMQCVCVYVCVV